MAGRTDPAGLPVHRSRIEQTEATITIEGVKKESLMIEERLKKHLKFPAVFAFGIGPMLSSGIFLLPGMVFAKVGPASILAYLVAGVLIIPSLLSKAELATAMPRAGGTYYFLDRSMGPMVGTIAGIGTWLALSFKSAFDLIGLGAYLVIFLALPVKPVALALCVGFGALSITGVKNVGRLQGILVATLLGLLVFFIARGIFQVDHSHFTPFFLKGSGSFLGAVGFVYVGFTGLTKVASMAEEVDNPDRILPLGMLAALSVTMVIYMLAMYVIIGLVPAADLAHTLTPFADTARTFMGDAGVIVMAVAALIAFSASANAGLTSASRYPLAMSRDRLISTYFRKLGRFHTPARSIILTTGFMVVLIMALSPEGIAKLASAFQILIFGLINLAVIVMRESKIASYDPGFRSILYPWLQIIGILSTVILIPELGMLPVIASGTIVLVGVLWYIYYAQKRVARGGAMFQVFQRLGQAASTQVDRELRQILREKGLRKEDTFEESIITSDVLFHEPGQGMNEVLEEASGRMAQRMGIAQDRIFDGLNQANRLGETPVGKNIALPHTRLEEAESHHLVIVHSRDGISIEASEEPIYALFILVGPRDDPGRHLRFLAELANRAEGIDFAGKWRQIRDADEIKSQFVRTGEVVEIFVQSPALAGKKIREFQIHEDCLIALITRQTEMIVPHGDTHIEVGDKLTLIGEEAAVREVEEYFQNLQ